MKSERSNSRLISISIITGIIILYITAYVTLRSSDKLLFAEFNSLGGLHYYEILGGVIRKDGSFERNNFTTIFFYPIGLIECKAREYLD